MPYPAPDPAAHVGHDPVLVAAYAAGDATGAELEAAATLVAGCAVCAALHHDLRAIAVAMPLMPAPRRTRDFRLTTEQAASLRPAGWRRLLTPFAGPRFAFAAPLGSGLAALGLVGILLAGPGLPLGGATAGPVPAEAPLPAALPMNDGSPVAEDGYVASTGAPDIQGAVGAPGASAGPTSLETGTGADPSDGTSNKSVGEASPPAEDSARSSDASQIMADRQEAPAMSQSIVLFALAVVAVVVGAVMAGLRVLSRRVV